MLKPENKSALENLSLYCYYCGIIPIFLGILVAFMDVINGNIPHVIVGIFMFISGYAFVKISSKISIVLMLEQKR